MKKYIFIALVLSQILLAFDALQLQAQTNTFPTTGSAGIGTLSPNLSSALDIVSTSKGVLIPRMTKAQRNAIASPTTGLLIYQTNSAPGFYYYRGTQWVSISYNSTGWNLTGNADTDTSLNFVGTTDGKPLRFKVNGRPSGIIDMTAACTSLGFESLLNNDVHYNSAFGYRALYSNTNGDDNFAAGVMAMYSNTSGYRNVAVGNYALQSNTTARNNTAIGYYSMSSSTTGGFNTAVGYGTLQANTDGVENTAIGIDVLSSNTLGTSNAAVGASSMQENTTGYENSALGYESLFYNTTGIQNTSCGGASMYFNTTGSKNTGAGYTVMRYNTTGYENTAMGNIALYNNTTGGQNAAFGYNAGGYNDANTYCTFIGYDANQSVTTDFTNSTAIGNGSRITSSNQIRIGNPFINSIGGFQNWSNISDGRYKKDVQETVMGLEFINKLRPVVYHLDMKGLSTFFNYADSSIDKNAMVEKEKILYSGFIAQEVEAAAAEVNYNFSGVDAPKNENDLYGLRYAEFVVPLVKSVQELSAENEALKSQNEYLQNQIDNLNRAVFGSESNNSNKKINSPESNSLGLNIPNPFDNSTIIPFQISADCISATIIIAESATGKIISSIPVSCSEKQISVDAKLMSAGNYIYSLFVDGKLVDVKNMVVVK